MRCTLFLLDRYKINYGFVVKASRSESASESGNMGLIPAESCKVLKFSTSNRPLDSKSQMWMFRDKTVRVKLCQCEIAHDEMREKNIESKAIQKRTCQSTYGLSLMQNGQVAAESFHTLWELSHVSRLTATRSNH